MSDIEIQRITQILDENRKDFDIILKLILIELKRINTKKINSNGSLIVDRPSFRIKKAESIFEKIKRKIFL